MLEARNIDVSFGGLAALSDVSLTVPKDQVIGLIGPNGAGKTTMVNVLSGFQRPSRGSVVADDRSLSGLPPYRVARFGIARTFQAGRLFKRLTVLENLQAAGVGQGLSAALARRSALEALSFVGCEEHAHVAAGALSYGEERRVGIARALALAPRYALLDEPASGLNEDECGRLVDLVRAIPGAYNCGVLLIEHNMQVIMAVCQRIVVLDGGRKIAEGSGEEVRSDPAVRRAYLGDRAASVGRSPVRAAERAQ
jgi:branched-chain amino acid transport system ATP-binding protein